MSGHLPACHAGISGSVPGQLAGGRQLLDRVGQIQELLLRPGLSQKLDRDWHPVFAKPCRDRNCRHSRGSGKFAVEVGLLCPQRYSLFGCSRVHQCVNVVLGEQPQNLPSNVLPLGVRFQIHRS